MIIDCISDLHGYYPKLEGGDLLIVAGDLTARDTQQQHIIFLSWLSQQDYRKKIWIAGNHDNFLMGTKYIPIKDEGMEYLCDSGTEFEGLKIWGSPWTKTFEGMNPHCKAFTCDTEEELATKFSLISHDTDILITHGPPYGIYDKIEGEKLGGSTSLLLRTVEIKPLIHCYGHLHECGGRDCWVPWKNGTTFINCSHVNEDYKPVNKPIRVIL